VWTQPQMRSTAAAATTNASNLPHAATASVQCFPGKTGQIVVDVEQSAPNLATIAVKANASWWQAPVIHRIAALVVGCAEKVLSAAKAIVRIPMAPTAPTAAGAASCAVLVQIVAKVRANLCVEVVILPTVGGAGRNAKLG
jgi:hypothetical protein